MAKYKFLCHPIRWTFQCQLKWYRGYFCFFIVFTPGYLSVHIKPCNSFISVVKARLTRRTMNSVRQYNLNAIFLIFLLFLQSQDATLGALTKLDHRSIHENILTNESLKRTGDGKNALGSRLSVEQIIKVTGNVTIFSSFSKKFEIL